jgi:hypothetical protein
MSYPPTFDYYQPAGGSSHARRASVMMYVIGALVLLSGFCCLGMGAMVPKLAQRPDFARTIHSIPNMTPALFQAGMLVMGVIAAIIGIAYIVLGIFVGKASGPAIITAIVLSILCELLLLLYAAAVFTKQGSPAAICFLVVPLVLIGVLLSWLFQAQKSPRRGNMPADYANQYWQYYQQQQNQGMGPYVPPAPPPQMFPPPQPPPPQNPPVPPPPPADNPPQS